MPVMYTEGSERRVNSRNGIHWGGRLTSHGEDLIYESNHENEEDSQKPPVGIKNDEEGQLNRKETI